MSSRWTAEAGRIARLITRSGQRSWLRYLHGVLALIESRAGSPDPAVRRAVVRAAAVLSNHHNLLLALPGAGRAAHRRRPGTAGSPADVRLST